MIPASNEELDIFHISQPQQGSSQSSIETCTSANNSIKKRSKKVHPLSVLESSQSREGEDIENPRSRKNTTAVSIFSEEANDNASKETNVGKDKNTSFWWWEPGESLLLDFLKLTSLHGLTHVAQSKRHLTERLFWLVTFSIGLGLAFYLIGDLYAKASSNPVIVSFRAEKSSVDQIPFPAVTICNMNKILKSKAEEYSGPFGNPEDAYYLRHVCETTKSFSKLLYHNYTGNNQKSSKTSKAHLKDEAMFSDDTKKEWTKVTEFLVKAAQNCTDMIPFCMWQNKIIDNCSELFRPVETEYGKCCVFNTIPHSLLYKLRDDDRDDENEIYQWEQWDIDDDGFLLPKDYKYDFPRRQMQAGKSFGLSFGLNPELDEYFCTSSYSQGFRMSAHLSIDSNRVTDFGISLTTGSETFVSVNPEITLVDPAIYKLAVGTRDCYKLEEYPLKYFKYYTTSNCVQECIANETLRACGCKAYYMPRDKAQSLCSANLSGSSCADEVEYNMTRMGSTNVCKMCLPSCNEINYQTKSTVTKLHPIVWRNNLENYKMTLANENLSIVHVFFGRDAVYPRVRKVLFESADLIGSAGGVMGLCLGFSGMSLVELLYFLTLRAWWWNYKRNQDEMRSEDTSEDATTDVTETSRSGASIMDRDLEAADDDEPIFIKRNHEFTEAGRELPPRVSIEDECSTFVELE